MLYLLLDASTDCFMDAFTDFWTLLLTTGRFY